MNRNEPNPTPSPPQARPAAPGAPKVLNAVSVVERSPALVSHFPNVSAGLHGVDFSDTDCPDPCGCVHCIAERTAYTERQALADLRGWR